MEAWPPVWEVRQQFAMVAVEDVAATARAALAALDATCRPRPGDRVAITAGSRGIDRIAVLLRAVADHVRACGAEPFLLAAMGSHGGGTAAGQRAVLAGYALTPEVVGCPVEAATEAREIGCTPEGVPVMCSRPACEADGIILVNRVKPHTILTGSQGSGLMKMAAIGLGGPAGANLIHAHGLAATLLPSARVVLQQLPILCGVAVVENAFDRICTLEALPPAAIEAADARLLAQARTLLPGIPFDPIDLLVVRRIGKNLSGTGMDPNVIGLHRRLGGTPTRHIDRIVALDLTPESHGNAIGVGMADLITERLRAKIDWESTAANGLTSGFFAGIKLPLALPHDRAAIAAALKGFDPERVRLVIIEDTAHLARLHVSAALAAEARQNEQLAVAAGPLPLAFSAEGDLLPFPE
ncbi:MAG: DUF362 domain-containing protein [Armatimonadetes bacterium]|jgi:hypothetical protein|nr:DUF362 domain-containing protein [Armatimonadota bacterium]